MFEREWGGIYQGVTSAAMLKQDVNAATTQIGGEVVAGSLPVASSAMIWGVFLPGGFVCFQAHECGIRTCPIGVQGRWALQNSNDTRASRGKFVCLAFVLTVNVIGSLALLQAPNTRIVVAKQSDVADIRHNLPYERPSSVERLC